MYIDLSDSTQESVTDVGLNTILYGPPGTGKTYHTVIYAVAIIENKELSAVEKEDCAEVLERYNEYKAQGRMEYRSDDGVTVRIRFVDLFDVQKITQQLCADFF